MLSPLTRSVGLISFLLLRPTTLAVAYTPSTRTRNMASTQPKQHASLEEAGVVPDVLPNFHPSVQLRVSYDQRHVRMGDQLLPVQAVHVPLVSLEGGAANKNYTLIMSDPDAPSPKNPTHREWLHWLVTDIPGDASNIAGGHQVVPYAPPTPPKGTHRYVFSAFEQPGGHLSVHAPAARGKFHTQQFAKQHGLKLVGATYFSAAHQE